MIKKTNVDTTGGKMDTLIEMIAKKIVIEESTHQLVYTCHIGQLLSKIKECGIEWFICELKNISTPTIQAAYLHIIYKAMTEVTNIKSKDDLINLEKITYLLSITRPLIKSVSMFDQFSQYDFWNKNVFFTENFKVANIREADFDILVWFLEYIITVEHMQQVNRGCV